MMSIAERPVTPGRCTLLFGIPTDQAAFNADLANDRGKDFVRRNPEWERYWKQVARPAQQLSRHAQSLGAHVVSNACFSDYAEALRAPNDVVILISHWRGETVELYDGMHAVDALVNSIPDNFDGLLDLCVCTPSRLALSVRGRRASTLVRYAPVLAWPPLWFGYFEALLTRLSEASVTYARATSEVTILFMTSTGSVAVRRAGSPAAPPQILFGDLA